MRKIKTFGIFEKTTSNSNLKNLDWLKSFIDESTSNKYKFTMKKNQNFLSLYDDKHTIELYDNEKENNFFFIRIKKDGKTIQDFNQNNNGKKEFSKDEIASENILQYISRYFQKV
jgi:hypothetical protein